MKTNYWLNQNHLRSYLRIATAGAIELITKNVSIRELVNRFPRWRGFILTSLVLACLALSPALQAAPTQNVNVVNTPAVRDVNNPAQSPFTFHFQIVIDDGEIFGSASFQVPAGKRLVIEQVSFLMTPGEDMMSAVVMTKLAGAPAVNSYFTGAVNVEAWVATSQLRCYADGGTTVVLTAVRRSTIGDITFVEFNVSGYLVNMP
jgi:hypothetical protein